MGKIVCYDFMDCLVKGPGLMLLMAFGGLAVLTLVGNAIIWLIDRIRGRGERR